jgi:hypothetical protein
VTAGYDAGGVGVQVAGPDSRVPPLPPGGGGAGEGLARGPHQVVPPLLLLRVPPLPPGGGGAGEGLARGPHQVVPPSSSPGFLLFQYNTIQYNHYYNINLKPKVKKIAPKILAHTQMHK